MTTNTLLITIAALAACSPTHGPTVADAVPAEVAKAPPPEPEAEAEEDRVEEEAPPPAPAGPTFFEVATVAEAKTEDGEGAPHFRVFQATGGEVFVGAGPELMPVGKDGTITRDPRWLEGIETFRDPDPGGMVGVALWDVVAAGGRMPGAFYITVSAETGFRAEAYPSWVYRRVNDQWVAVKTKGKHFYWYPIDLAPWKDNSVLALREFSPDHYFFYYEDEQGPTKKQIARAKRSIEKQKKLVVIRGLPKAPDLGRQDFIAFDALASGEIMALVGGQEPRVVHYDPATDTATERELPSGDVASGDVVIEAPDRAWVYGGTESSPFLARFDGKTWSAEPVPESKEGISSFSQADGDQWIVCGSSPSDPLFGDGGSLWHRAKDGPWQSVTLPDNGAAIEVLALAKDDVWVAGDRLFHTRKAEQTVVTPNYSDIHNEILERADPVGPLACEHGTTLLEGVTKADAKAVAAELDKEFGGDEEWGGTLMLVEVEFRGEQRIALHSVAAKRIAKRVKKVLGNRLGETYCVFRAATQEFDSWYGG